MGKTIVEKIFSKKKGSSLRCGESVLLDIDYAMATDGTFPLAITEFKKIKVNNRVYDPDRIIIVNDHFVPANTIESADTLNEIRDFVLKNDIKHFYDVGRGGICHVVVPELGIIKPGDIVVGADSHTVTYGGLGAFSTGIGSTDFACVMATGKLWFRVPETIKVVLSGHLNKDVMAKDIILNLISRIGVEGANYCAVEFYGNIIKEMCMSERLSLCNMVVEMGAKSAIIPPDNITRDYYAGRNIAVDGGLCADHDAVYLNEIEMDVSDIYPSIALPYSPANVKKVNEIDDIKVNQVVIGSCTNGRIEDFRAAYRLIKGKKFSSDVRVVIIPGSQSVLLSMIEEGILSEFVRAGAIISPSTCGVCMGGHMGILGKDEVGLFTTNRNFCGRSGHKSSKVYLCNPLIATASAISGKISLPKD